MSTYKNRRTPGVYVTELNAFPRSVPGVQTAVPAFIGYTEQASIGGKPAYLKPVAINSLADYQQVFGGAFYPIYDIKQVTSPTATNYDFMAQIWDDSKKTFVPTYYALERTHEVPIHAMAELALADHSVDAGNPALGTFTLYDSVRLFYENGGGPCFVVSVGPYATTDTDSKKTLSPVTKTSLDDGLDAIREQVGPTMLVVPDAVLLGTGGEFHEICQKMLQQCADLQDRVAILDIYDTGILDPRLPAVDLSKEIDNRIEAFRTGIGERYLNYGMAYFPFLVTSVITPREITYTSISATMQTGLLTTILTNQASYLYPGTAPGKQGPTDNDNPAFTKQIMPLIKRLDPTNADHPKDTSAVNMLDQNLVNAIPLMGQIQTIIATKMSLLPASGAMAGVYSYIDSTRGVWNAPANVTLNSVLRPNVNINGGLQGPLNAPIGGKSVNVIREFVGRGPVVWGARTLDGNSLDWRYIQVRRTSVYIEQSIKTALNQFVFAANNGSTWVAVTAMVSNFLQNLWSQGGLMGDKASEAFTVQCGKGSTMTDLDILEGYMIVQVTLQMIHPAEFIELTFKQRMGAMG